LETHRLKLVIEYDGTEFAGFQLQGKGERTVQGVLEQTLKRLSGDPIVIHGAGRTDSGVHALGQVVHFDTSWKMPVDRMARVLNGALPNDLSVRSSMEVGADFHSRFSAKQRTYCYLIWTKPQRSAIWCRYALHEGRLLDIDAMRTAALALKGSRDFVSFASAGGSSRNGTVREVRTFSVRDIAGGRFILFRITANGFLRSMVRNLIGGLRSVGLGEISPRDLTNIADRADRSLNPCAAVAPNGLCLWRVDY
jgi:tRNA pseudouridine38-40 synthase